MKYFVLSLVMFAAGVAVTQIDREPVEFSPVVRIRTADGLFVTFVQAAMVKRRRCGEAVEVFSKVLQESCATCYVESTACQAELQGIERALARNEKLPIYTVDAASFRVAVVGPPAAVRGECENMASHMRDAGLKAVCREPEAGAATVR